MPPNVKGGKGYRKGKHSGLQELKIIEWDEEQGQMLGRTMKKLGDRRFRIFCNDNKERICKLAGSMRKSDWVDEGSIVLIGIRDLTTSTTSKGAEVGDILSVIEMQLYGKLKKQEGVNPLLFTHVETEEKSVMARKIQAQESGQNVDDDVFERDGEASHGEDEEYNNEEEPVLTGIEGEEQKKRKEKEREESRKLKDQEISSKRSSKYRSNGDVDIDNL
uniref:S1-like domain-containing protein n=1 Tax=viral metagenome TaxID=1070528 RepID=A0A6C0KP13_9ZZZZ